MIPLFFSQDIIIARGEMIFPSRRICVINAYHGIMGLRQGIASNVALILTQYLAWRQ